MIKFFLIILLSTTLTSSFPIFDLQTTTNQTLELIERKTRAIVEGPIAELQYIYTYKNPFANPVETQFLFHCSQDYFFNKFEAIIANETIVYKVQEKPIVHKTYIWNTERTNQTEIHPHQDQVTSELIDIHIGSLLPNQNFQIILSVAQPLSTHLFKFYELKLPILTSKNNLNQNLKEWSIEVEIRCDQPLVILSNPTHRLKPEISQSPYRAFYNATLTLDKDFIVYFAPEDLTKVQVSPAVHPHNSNDYLILLSAVPDLKYFSTEVIQNTLENQFEDGLLKLYKTAFEIDEGNSASQYVFMLDRSDSMKGEPLENIKRAALALLRTLPESHQVVILSFGSTFEFFRPDKNSVYLPTVREAIKFVEDIQADMGEKDLLKPLKEIAKGYYFGQIGKDSIFIFTDGEISNSDEILEIIISIKQICVYSIVTNQKASAQDILQSINQRGRCKGEFVIDDQDLDERAFQFLKENSMEIYFAAVFEVRCQYNKNQLVYKNSYFHERVYADHPWIRWVYLDDNVDFKSCKLDFVFHDESTDIFFEEKMTINELKDAKSTDLYHKIAYGMKINELKKEFKTSHPQHHNTNRLSISPFAIKFLLN